MEQKMMRELKEKGARCRRGADTKPDPTYAEDNRTKANNFTHNESGRSDGALLLGRRAAASAARGAPSDWNLKVRPRGMSRGIALKNWR